LEASLHETPLNVLLVEDDEDDAALLVFELKRNAFRPNWKRVDTTDALIGALKDQPWDVIICDYKLPQFTGETTLRIVRETVGPDVPVIFVSGAIGEETVVRLMRDGAQDCVLKDKLARLPVAINRELNAAQTRREKNLADSKLEDQVRLTHGLMANLPDAIYFKDTQRRYTALNAAECRMLGAEREGEVLGKTADDFLPPERARRWRIAEERMLKTGQSLVDTVAHVAEADGRMRWYSVTEAPLRSRGGEILGLVGISRDITERKLDEQLRNEFISTVSHELRTPLTSIAGSLGLVAGGAAGVLPPNAMNLMKIARSNCERLIRLVNDILDMERIESGRLEAKPGLVNVRLIAAEAIDANRGFAENFGVTVRLAAGGEDGAVLADPDWLAQIMTNLLANAIKFSPRGGEVAVAVDSGDSTVGISVRDHGPGVPEEFRERIFEKFVQVDASDAREKGGGTGLGLSIVKGIVERLGGKVACMPAPGGGAIFRVTLPRHAPAGLADAPEAATPLRA
jgi:PAS domain S-box-containing protein